LNSRPTEVQGRIFEKLFKAAEIKKLTETDMETYNKSILEYQDVRDAVDYAKEEYFEKGIEKGIERGIERGAKQGRKEAIETTARKCLEKGMSIELVVEVTGLSAEQLINL
jgi:predicted transposase/invertase (TIGR01784 family)